MLVFVLEPISWRKTESRLQKFPIPPSRSRSRAFLVYGKLHCTWDIMSYERNTDYKEISLAKTTITKLQNNNQGSVWARFQVRQTWPGSRKRPPDLELELSNALGSRRDLHQRNSPMDFLHGSPVPPVPPTSSQVGTHLHEPALRFPRPPTPLCGARGYEF